MSLGLSTVPLVDLRSSGGKLVFCFDLEKWKICYVQSLD